MSYIARFIVHIWSVSMLLPRVFLIYSQSRKPKKKLVRIFYHLLPDTESGFIVSPSQGCSQKLRNLFRRQLSSATGFSSLAVVKTITKKKLTWDVKQVLLAAGVCWGRVIASTRATAPARVGNSVSGDPDHHARLRIFQKRK